MALIDEQFMADVGLAEMPAAEKQAFMEQAKEELEVRVGQSLSASLSDAQLEEFERLNGTPGVGAWLEENVPNFRVEVIRVLQDFKNELMTERQSYLA